MSKQSLIENGISREKYISRFLDKNTTEYELSKEYDEISSDLRNVNSSYKNNYPKDKGNGKLNLNIKNPLTAGMKSENLTETANSINDILRNPIGEIINRIGNIPATYQEKTIKLFEAVNEKIGMSGKLATDFQREIRSAHPEAELLGVDFDKLLSAVGNLVDKSGKFKILDKQSIINMADAGRFVDGGIDGFSRLAIETEKYSMGVNQTATMVKNMMKDSIESGLNYKKVISGVQENIDKLNQYGFKNGVDGLKKMSQIAIEFRGNINDAFQLAEKVWSPEKALETVANLQMIGGAVGDLNDPLKLMYMATNDVEGLQESLIKATESLSTYNSEQGRFVVTGANLRRAKEMADQFGISMDQIGKYATASAERTQASLDIMSSGLEFVGENAEKDKEFITNLARMENGKMVISIPDNIKDKFTTIENGQVDLASMNKNQMSEILKYRREIQGMSVEDIGRQQVNIQTNILRSLSFLVAKAQFEIGKTGENQFKELFEMFGMSRNDITKNIFMLSTGVGKGIEVLNKNLDDFINSEKENQKLDFEKTKSGLKKELDIDNKQTSTSKTKTENITTTENINYNIKISSGDVFTDPIYRDLVRKTEIDYLNPLTNKK